MSRSGICLITTKKGIYMYQPEEKREAHGSVSKNHFMRRASKAIMESFQCFGLIPLLTKSAMMKKINRKDSGCQEPYPVSLNAATMPPSIGT